MKKTHKKKKGISPAFILIGLLILIFISVSLIPPFSANVETDVLTETVAPIIEPAIEETSSAMSEFTYQSIPDDFITYESTVADIGNPIPEVVDDNNMYNGYWWAGEGWVAGLPTLATQFLRMPPVTIGSAVFYAPQAMEANVFYHGLPYNEDYYVGSVAVPFCSEIGHSVWLKRPNSDEWEGAFLVADCSRRNDMYGHIMFRDQVVEVDFETAVRWGMARYTTTNEKGWMALTGRMDAVLLSKVNPALWDGTIVDLSEWFPTVVQYAEFNEPYRNVQNYVPPAYDGTVWGGLGFKNPSSILPMWLINDVWTIFP